MFRLSNRLGLLEREDGIVISTVEMIALAWHGRYETAITIDDCPWMVIEGYNTLEDAVKGHEKYSKMSREELERLDAIG